MPAQHKMQRIDKDESRQSTLKVELHERKVMLCVWWDQCGIIRFESPQLHLMQIYTLNNSNVLMKT